MVERGPEKAGVGGSSPSLATTLSANRSLDSGGGFVRGAEPMLEWCLRMGQVAAREGLWDSISDVACMLAGASRLRPQSCLTEFGEGCHHGSGACYRCGEKGTLLTVSDRTHLPEALSTTHSRCTSVASLGSVYARSHAPCAFAGIRSPWMSQLTGTNPKI